MKSILIQKLNDHFQPDFLEVLDQSHLHAGHNDQAKQGGTHFQITIQSKLFKGLSKIQCHRMIYQLLDHELKTKIHALSLNIRS